MKRVRSSGSLERQIGAFFLREVEEGGDLREVEEGGDESDDLELREEVHDRVGEEVEARGAGGEEGAPPPVVVLVAELRCGARVSIGVSVRKQHEN